MKIKSWSFRRSLVLSLAVAASLSLWPLESAVYGEKSPALGIRGSMQISFGSRTQEEGIDTYDINLVCADALRVKGKILREPGEISSVLGREKRPQELKYYLALSVINPTNKSEEKRAGLFSGKVQIHANGVYDLSQLKIEASLPSFTNPLAGEFGGKIRGKFEKSRGVLGATYSRYFGGKKITIALSRTDPLSFEGIRIAGGPLALYPASIITGKFDYDYDTGNWITPGIEIRSGANIKDTITGTIKWVPDERRDTNGLSRYEFNLRFNEASVVTPTDETAAFASLSDEEAFFVVDDRIPTLKGSITYRDQFGYAEGDEEPPVVSSQIEYALEGDKVTKQQLISFLKLWLLLVGPVNDE